MWGCRGDSKDEWHISLSHGHNLTAVLRQEVHHVVTTHGGYGVHVECSLTVDEVEVLADTLHRDSSITSYNNIVIIGSVGQGSSIAHV